MKIVDYLAEEIKREEDSMKSAFEIVTSSEQTQARKAGKHERMKKLVVSLQAKAAAAGR